MNVFAKVCSDWKLGEFSTNENLDFAKDATFRRKFSVAGVSIEVLVQVCRYGYKLDEFPTCESFNFACYHDAKDNYLSQEDSVKAMSQ